MPLAILSVQKTFRTPGRPRKEMTMCTVIPGLFCTVGAESASDIYLEVNRFDLGLWKSGHS